MLRTTQFVSLVAGALLTAHAFSQAPAAAPAGSTGLCKDGSYWTGATKKGACRGHKGVQEWYGSADAPASGSAATPAAPAAPAAAAASAPAAAPAATAAPAPAPAGASSKSNWTPPANAAPGGGPGLVWVNSSSKVYHCQSDRWYGKTKHGSYMSEADAVAQGNRPDHGKACAK